eukprot:5077712-Pleurochrysis_carterae.AAC.1
MLKLVSLSLFLCQPLSTLPIPYRSRSHAVTCAFRSCFSSSLPSVSSPIRQLSLCSRCPAPFSHIAFLALRLHDPRPLDVVAADLRACLSLQQKAGPQRAGVAKPGGEEDGTRRETGDGETRSDAGRGGRVEGERERGSAMRTGGRREHGGWAAEGCLVEVQRV